MEPYSVVDVRYPASGGIEIIISGPGIPSAGVPYWFTTADEVHSFVRNLNLSYKEAKTLATARKARSRTRIPEATTLSATANY